MLLLLRRMKQGYFNNTEFRKYLLYALGEMALVVTGILLALQIDNWNTNRLEQDALGNYLHTIARNIGSDLDAIDEIRSERIEARELSVRWVNFDGRGNSYTVPQLSFAARTLNAASTLLHFSASNSGYESLKSSGLLDQMQGADIEQLLYDYYDTATRIARQEQDHNELSRLLALQVRADWPDEFDRWELETPYVLTTDRIESLQPAYRRLLLDSATEDLMYSPQTVGSLLLEYDRLDRIGKAFRWLVEIDTMTLDETASEILGGIYDPGSGAGQPNVIVDGQIAWHSYDLLNSDANDPRVSYEASAAGLQSPFNFNSFQRIGDSLHISIQGGAAWAGIWFAAGTNSADRRSLDYSMYDTLVLELKGDAGGEKIFLNLEDRDDPADGTSTRYELQLSDQWQTYEIDLAEFETADLSILTVPLGFVFIDGPVAFSVRTAKFIKSD
jgi:hypothetical protein